MSNDVLEQRLAALESEVGAIRTQLESHLAAQSQQEWWNRPRPPVTAEDRKAWGEIDAYGRYFRMTGQEAPPDWKPGDPIPEPRDDE